MFGFYFLLISVQEIDKFTVEYVGPHDSIVNLQKNR